MKGPHYVAIVCFAIAAFLFLYSGRDQRRLWWKLDAWRYRDPSANEPSEAAYRTNRWVATFAGVFLVIVGLVLLGA